MSKAPKEKKPAAPKNDVAALAKRVEALEAIVRAHFPSDFAAPEASNTASASTTS